MLWQRTTFSGASHDTHCYMGIWKLVNLADPLTSRIFVILKSCFSNTRIGWSYVSSINPNSRPVAGLQLVLQHSHSSQQSGKVFLRHQSSASPKLLWPSHPVLSVRRAWHLIRHSNQLLIMCMICCHECCVSLILSSKNLTYQCWPHNEG